MSYFDYEYRLPCKVFTPEEIAATYGERATRPIPNGYNKRVTVRARIEAQSAKSHNKPWAVYAQYGDGRRMFVSAHHSDTAAENKADIMNQTLGKVSDFVYTIGERIPSEGKKDEDRTDKDSESQSGVGRPNGVPSAD